MLIPWGVSQIESSFKAGRSGKRWRLYIDGGGYVAMLPSAKYQQAIESGQILIVRAFLGGRMLYFRGLRL